MTENKYNFKENIWIRFQFEFNGKTLDCVGRTFVEPLTKAQKVIFLDTEINNRVDLNSVYVGSEIFSNIIDFDLVQEPAELKIPIRISK